MKHYNVLVERNLHEYRRAHSVTRALIAVDSIWYVILIVLLAIGLSAVITSVAQADSIVPNGNTELTSLYNHVQDNDSYAHNIPVSVMSHFAPFVQFEGQDKKDRSTNDLHGVTSTSNNGVATTVLYEQTPAINEQNSERGNPGNGKNVGNAGEHCNQEMCENTDGQTGEHGNSHND